MAFLTHGEEIFEQEVEGQKNSYNVIIQYHDDYTPDKYCKKKNGSIIFTLSQTKQYIERYVENDYQSNKWTKNKKD